MSALSQIELNPDPADFPHASGFGLIEVATYDDGSMCLIWQGGKAGGDLASLCESLALYVLDGHAADPMLADLCGWGVVEAVSASAVGWVLPPGAVPGASGGVYPVGHLPPVWCCSTGYVPPVPPQVVPPPHDVAAVPLPAGAWLLLAGLGVLALLRRVRA